MSFSVWYRVCMSGTELIQELSERARKIGLARVDICQKAGIAPLTFRRWVNGEVVPRYHNLLEVKRIVEEAESALKEAS